MSEETNPRHLEPSDDSDQTARQAPPARVADQAYLQALKARSAERDKYRNVRHALLGVLAAVGVVVLLFVGSVVKVYLDANAIVSSAKTVPAALLSGDSDTINTAVDDIKGQTGDMHFVVNTPIWNLGCVLPGIGQDFRNIQQLSGLLNDVSDSVLDPLASDSGEIAGNDVMSEDTINVSALLKVSEIVQNLTPALQSIGERASSMERGVIPQVNDVVAMVKTYTSQLSTLSDTLGKLTRVLPSMLGAEGGSKSYLLIAQNSAELRPTGGIPGVWCVVTVDNGKINIGDFGHPDNVSRDSTPVFTLTQDDTNIMGDFYAYMRPDVFWVSSNFDPDFSNSAQHFETYWKLLVEQGITGSSQTDLPTDIDGVVAVNPILVQRLLGLTSGFDVHYEAGDESIDDHIDGTNAAKAMLSDAYWKLDPEYQDAYFSQVASGAVSTIMSNVSSMDLSGLMSVMQDAMDRGDLVMYFNDETVESVVEDFNADGKISDDETTPILGTYFYDITWSKMDWYLNSSTTITNATENEDGSITYDVSTTLINEMTEDEASNNPPQYVVGYGDNPLVAHTGGMATVVFLYAPAGGTITDLTSEAGQSANEQFSETTAEGHDIWRGVVVLDPERKETLTYKVTTSPSATSQLTVDSTPTLVEVAGWQDDDKPDSDFEYEDGDAYGSVEADDSTAIDNLLSSSATSGRSSSTSSSSSSSTYDSYSDADTSDYGTDTTYDDTGYSDEGSGYYDDTGYTDTSSTDTGYDYDYGESSSDGYDSSDSYGDDYGYTGYSSYSTYSTQGYEGQDMALPAEAAD